MQTYTHTNIQKERWINTTIQKSKGEERRGNLMVREGGACQLPGSGSASTVGPHSGVTGMRAPASSHQVQSIRSQGQVVRDKN
jgi:hypothetical protein